MTKAVLTTKVNPTYDDLPECQYHFPRTYLRAMQATVGDWIVYYEPRRSSGDLASRGGRQAYFAAARVIAIREDHKRPNHYYADISDFLELARPVPFKEGSHYYEAGLQRQDGATSRGAFGRAVRHISESEYRLILETGFALETPAVEHGLKAPLLGLADEQVLFERPIIERLTRRPFREAAFATAIRTAYRDTCAFTGLKIINGGGRPEVQAAHIQPVAERGPDSVRNGLALCSTVHWMFDRGLVSLGDDYTILTAAGKVPDAIQHLIHPDRRLRIPDRFELRPHPQFLRFHRETVFKGSR